MYISRRRLSALGFHSKEIISKQKKRELLSLLKCSSRREWGPASNQGSWIRKFVSPRKIVRRFELFNRIRLIKIVSTQLRRIPDMVWKLAFIFTLVLRYLTNLRRQWCSCVKVAKRAADTMDALPQLRYLIGESFTRTSYCLHSFCFWLSELWW